MSAPLPPPKSHTPTWHPVKRAFRRIRAHFWFKCFGTMGVTAAFFAAYVYLLHNPSGTVQLMPITPIDGWIGLDPSWLPVYLSLWVYVSLPASMLTTRREVIHFGWRIGIVCLIGLSTFWLWPNAVPPRNVDWARYPGMAFLKGVDAAGNAFPSLHVATAMFSGLWLHRMAPMLGLGRRFRWVNAAWCAAICYSTVAVGQHVVVDVAGGALLGWIVAWLTYPVRPLSSLGIDPSVST